MAGLDSWPDYTDDTGDKVSGTVLDAAFLDEMKAAILEEIRSTDNPSEVLADLIDEIVDARGNKTSVDARLDVEHNENGTHKTLSDYATAVQLQAAAPTNWVMNDAFRLWAAGQSAVATGWTMNGSGAVGSAYATGYIGDFAHNLQRNGTDCNIAQYLMGTTSYAKAGGGFSSRQFGFGAWVYSAVASQARIRFYDGVTSTSTDYHTGGSGWEWLSSVHTVNSGATRLQIVCEVKGADGTCRFDGVTAFPSAVAPSNWVPCPCALRTLHFNIPGTIVAGTRKFSYRHSRPFYVQDVILTCNAAPTGAAILVDVNHFDGATFQSLFQAGSRPTIAIGATGGASAVPDATYADRYRSFMGTVATTSSYTDRLLTIDLDQIGSGTAGSDLGIAVRVLEFARPQEALLEYNDGADV